MAFPNASMSRRGFLVSACCAAASPVLTPASFAAVPGDNRFVTIILRGAMDGLDLVQPYADPLFAKLRPRLALTPDQGLIDLDGRFGLHPAAASLMPLWSAGELSFVHAVSTPYRDERSHFDGQDALETGTLEKGTLGKGNLGKGGRSGWLNRALAHMPRQGDRKAIDINTSMDLILMGPNRAEAWAPQSDLAMAEDEIRFLERLYAGDEGFARILAEARDTDLLADAIHGGGKRGEGIADMARLAAGLLSQEYRIASFSINGWDTHVDQRPQFARAVTDLSLAINTLKEGLGPQVWGKTVVLVITEFGRTARENGSGGTDHGTGGAALLAGGGIPGGRILGRWPGLSEDQLLDGRDLMPTGDVRELAAAMLYRQFDIAPDRLTTDVFPGLSFDKGSGYLRG